MATTNFYMGSLRYDPSGRKRKNHALKSTRRKQPISTGPLKMDTRTRDRLRAAQEFKEKYPSMMEEQMKGIATMHKSNAVPVINKEEATDIARMRRG